jgi:catechol 2,3-dioxygenase-like lactoylglutathione lyase family enzyme
MDLTDVRLLVHDFRGCLEFYRDVLGLNVRMEVPNDVYAELEAGAVHVSLYPHELMRKAVPSLHGTDSSDRFLLNLRVDDTDASYRQLRDRGVAFMTEPHDKEEWGIRVAHFRDPEGNLIEIYSPIQRAEAGE